MLNAREHWKGWKSKDYLATLVFLLLLFCLVFVLVGLFVFLLGLGFVLVTPSSMSSNDFVNLPSFTQTMKSEWFQKLLRCLSAGDVGHVTHLGQKRGASFTVSSRSKMRTKDGKVDEDQGKATGVNLRSENESLELQNFFRERKTIVTQHIDSTGFPKPKEVWLWKWEKWMATSSNRVCQRELVSAGLYFAVWRTSHEMRGNNGQLCRLWPKPRECTWEGTADIQMYVLFI